MDDPDASGYVHWLIYDLPADSTGLEAGVPTDETLADGSQQGINNSNEIGYTGPCPPGGEHEYRFRLYALDASPGLEPGARLEELESAMEGHILSRAEFSGLFSR